MGQTPPVSTDTTPVSDMTLCTQPLFQLKLQSFGREIKSLKIVAKTQIDNKTNNN